MVSRNHRNDPISGTFRKLKFPFKAEEFGLFTEAYSQTIGLKIYRNIGERSYAGEKRLVMKVFYISEKGLNLRYVYMASYFEMESDSFSSKLKIIGIDVV